MNITDPSSPPFLIAAAIEAVVTAGAFVGFEIIRRRHT
jgi:hypothetical protein